tara:strand:- start:406 stop:615 length:210 start_codon:yes stop_codon:yes gene_type:complete
MSFLTPKVTMPPPPPPPEPPAQTDFARAEALAAESLRQATGKRKGRGATVVAGALEEEVATGQTPTLLG